jgi:hypothetical protein
MVCPYNLLTAAFFFCLCSSFRFLLVPLIAGETDEDKLRQVFGPFGQIQDVSSVASKACPGLYAFAD